VRISFNFTYETAGWIIERSVLPPGPRSPGIVQITRWILRPLEFLEECQRRHGDVFTLTGPRFRAGFVVVAVPELVKEVFAADAATLLAGESSATLLGPMLGQHSLLTLDGADHLRQRRLLLPAFHGERMHAFAEVMRAITHASIDGWPLGTAFPIHTAMQSITLDVILQTVFGIGSTEHAQLRADLVELLEIAANPWLLFPGLIGLSPLKIPWLRIAKLKRAVDDGLYRMIAERRRRPRGSDVLAMMLEARDEDGRAMTDVELRDELVTLLLAGHETTATSLAWCFDRLLSHPPVLARLREDLAAGREEYLDAVIRETLRMRPIVPMIGRAVAKPFQLGRWTIPVGARIAPSIYLCGRRADGFPDPARFDPDRWLGVKPDPFTWFPFGGGVRRCIGMAFAMFEMRIVLSAVVQRAELRLAGPPATVVRRGITLAPSGGTRVVVIRREPRTSRAA
jgi:cytochrome P450